MTKAPTMDEIIQDQVDSIDEAVELLNKRLAKYDELKAQRERLMAARRALLGGTALTGEGGSRLRQQDIVEYLREHPGATPSIIANHFDVKQTIVGSHLYRGKGDRFVTDGNGAWAVRDPKNGVNTWEDVEVEEDD